MNERCSNCGAELFAGQQFCRQCGAPTRTLSSGEMPTQILDAGQQTAPQQGAGTVPLAGRDTGGVYHSSFAAQYQSPATMSPTGPAQMQPRKRRSWGAWLFALLALLVVFGAGSFFVARLVANQFQRKVIIRKDTARSVPAIPAIPALPQMPDMSDADTANLSPLDETGAEVSDDATVITKTFALKSGAAFSLQQVKGDVTIEGWDQDGAQVTITKHGGDEDDRAGVRIMQSATDKGLTLRTPEEMDDIKEIKYEIKLPRSLRQIEINAMDSDVKLSNLAGGVTVKTMKGDYSVKGLTGAVDLHTMKGDISVDLKGVSPTQAQSYNAVKGDITLAVEGANADVQAETVAGGASADEGLGVAVEKEFAGSRASGTVGRGGKTVTAKTVSGSVKIKK